MSLISVVLVRRAEIETRQVRIQGITGRIAQEQTEVVEKQTKVAIEQAKVAQEQAEIAQEQTEIAKEQREIAQEQAEIAKEKTEIAQEQAEIQELDGEISTLSTVDAGLQADVTGSLDYLDEDGAMKPVLLGFDIGHNIILWGECGRVTLNEKQYSIIKELYFADQRMMAITSLEEKVWGHDTLPSDNTAKVTVSTLNKALKAANCPYEVMRTKRSLKTIPVENPVTKKVMDITVQPNIEVYELIFRRSFRHSQSSVAGTIFG